MEIRKALINSLKVFGFNHAARSDIIIGIIFKAKNGLFFVKDKLRKKANGILLQY